jgi:cystathionine beta-lyase
LYDFDKLPPLHGNGLLKWDRVEEGVVPLWVADMDFAPPAELREVLEARARFPHYGYCEHNPAFVEAVAAWYHSQYQVALSRDEILWAPGTVLSLGMAVRAFSNPGDGVLIMTPVYTPFFNTIRGNRRCAVEAPMRLDEAGRFIFDEDALEKAVAGAEARGMKVPVALFCSPHNPGGRVWAKTEIAAFLAFAKRRGIVVASDEIHGDFVWSRDFVSAASFPEYADRVIVVAGANKSFNLGGLHISHLAIRGKKLRETMAEEVFVNASHEPDCFSELAVTTCYTRCGLWLAEAKSYLVENLEEAFAYLNGIPGVKTYMPGGTYLLWADVRGLIEKAQCKNDLELVSRLEKEAKVKITHGSYYGEAGAGFVRINAASPRSLLMEGLKRIGDFAARF